MTKTMQAEVVSEAVLILNLDRCKASARLIAASFISLKIKDFHVLLQLLSRVTKQRDFLFTVILGNEAKKFFIIAEM